MEAELMVTEPPLPFRAAVGVRIRNILFCFSLFGLLGFATNKRARICQWWKKTPNDVMWLYFNSNTRLFLVHLGVLEWITELELKYHHEMRYPIHSFPTSTMISLIVIMVKSTVTLTSLHKNKQITFYLH
jgi:hypothetical protein